jgi:transposase InsO family protein
MPAPWHDRVVQPTGHTRNFRQSRYVESFNGKLRDELLNGEVFNTLREAQVLIEEWRRHTNLVRPHSSLGYRPPAPETVPMARSQSSLGAGAAVMAL